MYLHYLFVHYTVGLSWQSQRHDCMLFTPLDSLMAFQGWQPLTMLQGLLVPDPFSVL
jgi:hypothetical protein